MFSTNHSVTEEVYYYCGEPGCTYQTTVNREWSFHKKRDHHIVPTQLPGQQPAAQAMKRKQPEPSDPSISKPGPSKQICHGSDANRQLPLPLQSQRPSDQCSDRGEEEKPAAMRKTTKKNPGKHTSGRRTDRNLSPSVDSATPNFLDHSQLTMLVEDCKVRQAQASKAYDGTLQRLLVERASWERQFVTCMKKHQILKALLDKEKEKTAKLEEDIIKERAQMQKDVEAMKKIVESLQKRSIRSTDQHA